MYIRMAAWHDDMVNYPADGQLSVGQPFHRCVIYDPLLFQLTRCLAWDWHVIRLAWDTWLDKI